MKNINFKILETLTNMMTLLNESCSQNISLKDECYLSSFFKVDMIAEERSPQFIIIANVSNSIASDYLPGEPI